MTGDKILATVAGEAITERDVEEMLLAMGQSAAKYDNERGRSALLEQLINRKLLLLDAKRNLFERDPAFKEQLAKLKETGRMVIIQNGSPLFKGDAGSGESNIRRIVATALLPASCHAQHQCKSKRYG